MRKNLVSQTMSKKWVLDENKYSESQLEILEQVGFPKELSSNRVIQKRVAKKSSYGNYSPKLRLGLEDIRYVQVSRNVAIMQIKKYSAVQSVALDVEKGDKRVTRDMAKADQYAIENAIDATKSKPCEHYYIDGSKADLEIQNLLSMFSKPEPTPSMNSKANESTSVETKPDPEPTPIVKSLSNIHKGQAKKMYQEEKKSADEIAVVLGVEKERVIDYLKTL